MKNINLLIIFFLIANAGYSQKIPAEIAKYVAIPPIYQEAKTFKKNYAVVKINNLYGLIDKNGKDFIKASYLNISDFSEDVFIIYEKGGYWFKTLNEKSINKTAYSDAIGFRNEIAIIDLNGKGKYGTIDKNGKLTIPCIYNYIKSFNDGLAPAQKDSLWGFIDKSGTFIIKDQFEQANSFSEELSSVKIKGKWGFIDKKKDIKIKPLFDDALNFHQELCAVKQNKLWGFIDKTGKLVINYQFDEVSYFADGLAPVKKASKWGYIDVKGHFIINPVLDYAGVFSDGLANFTIKETNNAIYCGYILNPLKLKNKTIGQNDTIVSNPNKVNNTSLFKSCGEQVNGWEGNISNFHKIANKTGEIKVVWEFINKDYGLVIYEGKGLKGKELFKEKQIKYTGEKVIKINKNTEFITVQILAHKEGTEWKYILKCE